MKFVKHKIQAFILSLLMLILSVSVALAISPDDLDYAFMKGGWPGIVWTRTREEIDDNTMRILEEATIDGYPVSLLLHGSRIDPFFFNDNERFTLDEILFTAHCSQMIMDEFARFPYTLCAYNEIFEAIEEQDGPMKGYVEFNPYDFLHNLTKNAGSLRCENETWIVTAERTGDFITYHCVRKQVSEE